MRRFHRSLEPDGTLLLDNEAPYANVRQWRRWTKEERRRLPEPWPDSGERKRADDGTEYELRTRALHVDPLDQSVALEIRVEKAREGRVIETEERVILLRMYFRDELLLMLERAGFADVEVRGDYVDEPAVADHDFLVYVAHP